jgi:hypothetical protein
MHGIALMASSPKYKAVSQLLWPDKDREEWFSVRENHEVVESLSSVEAWELAEILRE